MSSITEKAKLGVSKGLADLRQCVGLATWLDMDPDYINKLSRSTFNDMTAYKLLGEWIMQKGGAATGRALVEALCNAELTNLADRHRAMLLACDGKMLATVNFCHC